MKPLSLTTSAGGREALRATIEADPFATLEELGEAGSRKAKAEAQAYHLENMRKIVLARLAGQIAELHASSTMSETKLERMARAHPEYEAHIRGTAAAIEEREHAQADYWRLRAELEWMDKTVSHANALSRLER